MKIKTTIAAVSAAFLLSACSGAPSVEELKSDQALLKKTLQDCGKKYKTKEEGMKDKACANAVEALKQKLQEGMNKLRQNAR